MPMPRPFPVLPIDDDELDGEAAKNDHILANRSTDRGRSHESTGPSRKSTTSSLLFALGPVLASLLSPKPATPTIEECEVRMEQIGSEIRKAQIMFDKTTNREVRSACRQQILKLAHERRFHQIVHERHRIQTMLQTTRVQSVRVACEERLRKLISELESLEASGEKDPGTGDASDNGPVGDSTGDACDEDAEWYDRVLEYVGGAEATHDKMLHTSSEETAHHHNGRAPQEDSRSFQPPQRLGRHGHNGEGWYPARDNIRRGRGDEDVSHEHDPESLSPRSDAACVGSVPPSSPPRQGGGRIIRHPVAYAVKSRTSCIG
jgi:hypothetical protein